MTRTETIEFLKQLPKDILTNYHMRIVDDITKEPCIHEKDFDYYPQDNLVIINGIIVKWDKSADWVSPYNPEHITEFKKRANELRKAYDTMIMVVSRSKDGKLFTQTMNPKHPRTKKYKDFPHVTFDGNTIYYYDDMVDLKNNKKDLLTAQAILVTEKQNIIGIDAEKNIPPEEWMVLDWR